MADRDLPRDDETLMKVMRSDLPDDAKKQIILRLIAEREAATAEDDRINEVVAQRADELIREAEELLRRNG